MTHLLSIVAVGLNFLNSPGDKYHLSVQDLPKDLLEQGYVMVNYPSRGPLPIKKLVAEGGKVEDVKGLYGCSSEWLREMFCQLTDKEFPLHFLKLNEKESASKYWSFIRRPLVDSHSVTQNCGKAKCRSSSAPIAPSLRSIPRRNALSK